MDRGLPDELLRKIAELSVSSIYLATTNSNMNRMFKEELKWTRLREKITRLGRCMLELKQAQHTNPVRWGILLRQSTSRMRVQLVLNNAHFSHQVMVSDYIGLNDRRHTTLTDRDKLTAILCSMVAKNYTITHDSD
jgi:hypothetical protein